MCMDSILKCSYGMKQFRGFRFITGLWPPPFLGITKRELMNPVPVESPVERNGLPLLITVPKPPDLLWFDGPMKRG